MLRNLERHRQIEFPKGHSFGREIDRSERIRRNQQRAAIHVVAVATLYLYAVFGEHREPASDSAPNIYHPLRPQCRYEVGDDNFRRGA